MTHGEFETVTPTVLLPLLLLVSTALTMIECEPPRTCVVSQLLWLGALVSVATFAPSTQNSTLATATLSLALAVTGTVQKHNFRDGVAQSISNSAAAQPRPRNERR